MAVAAPAGAQAPETPPSNPVSGQASTVPTTGTNPISTGSSASASGATAGVGEVVVTGTRIRSPNLTSNSPLTVVNSQEVKLQGATNIESVLNNLPSVVADQNSTISNGSDGTAAVNLRNLGSQRTLVLIDGRRLNPGNATSSPTPSAADLNFIPAALIDRVDVVTGGASAVYGSDAVAGVVNFIMKKNYQGLQIDTQYSFFNHQNGNGRAHLALTDPAAGQPANATIPSTPSDITSDGDTWTVSAIFGANTPDEKGNVTAYATYQNLQPVLQSSRDFSTCALSDLGSGFLQCAGSSNTPYGRFGSSVNNPDGSNSFIAYNGSKYSFDTSPNNYLQRNDDRYTAGYFAHYKINDHIEAYSDFMFLDDHTEAQIAPSGLFRGTGPFGGTNYSLNCNNPFLGATQVAALCPGVAVTPGAAGGATVTLPLTGYRFASLPRIDDLRHTDYKIDIGARGQLGQGWSYDAYLQYGISILSENYQNDVSTSRVQDALNVINDANGNPVCASTVAGTSRGCVPLNLFRAQGAGFTPAALGYVVAPGFQEGTSKEQIASINITGDLGQYGIKSPFATDGVGVAVGAEYRSESLDLRTDTEFQSGDLSGQGGATPSASGQYDVYELFGEVRVPILQNLPFARDLSFDGGYRYSDYSTVGNTNTYKGELSYSPIRDIRVRGSYNHAVRAPSTNELFAPRNVNLQSYEDPCSNGVSADGFPSQAQCALTGVTAAQYQATLRELQTGVAQNGSIEDCTLNQCSQLLQGNPSLRAETSDSYTGGFVLTPSFIPNLAISVDYFAIKVNHVIQQGFAPGEAILNNCLSGEQNYCALIHRDPTDGVLFGTNGYVVQTEVNAGFLRTNGIDVTANYRTRPSEWGLGLPDIGALTFSFVGTYTNQFTLEPGTGAFNIGTYDCAGQFGTTCGTPQPHWKSSLRTTLTLPHNFQVSLNWRYVGEVRQDNFSPQANLNSPGSQEAETTKINPFNYFDLAATYRFMDRYTFRVGIDNIVDTDPPVTGQDFSGLTNANTYPGVYDSLGRTIFMGLTADF